MIIVLIKACSDAVKRQAQAMRTLRRQTCLTFNLGGTRFGVNILLVEEIVRYQALDVPATVSQTMRGLLTYKHHKVPVIDLAARYGNSPLTPGARSCVIILRLGIGRWQRNVGLMVDEVLGLADFIEADLKPMPELAVRQMPIEVIQGVIELEQDYLVVLDALRLLTDEELEALFTD